MKFVLTNLTAVTTTYMYQIIMCEADAYAMLYVEYISKSGEKELQVES